MFAANCALNIPRLLEDFVKATERRQLQLQLAFVIKKHVWAHLSSEYHKQCKATEKATANAASNLNRGLMVVHIKEANRKLANHVGELLLHVYCDAKKLTLSAYNWPARFVAAKAGQNFDFVTSTSTIPNTIDIQFVNPVQHLDFLETITQSHREEFMEQIKDGLAYSIHIDGSVDRTQIDKVYNLLKVVTKNGDLKTYFIGVGQQTKRKASGLMKAVQDGIVKNVGQEIYDFIMTYVSSIVTDGTNVNTGDENSLWKHFEDECLKYRTVLPLNKFWCSAHRMELVWGDLTSKIKEVKRIIDIFSSVATHFRESAMRTEELK